MAGDWIKVEKNTPRKPEVLRIAAALDIHPDLAFGLCFRFWCWCDDHLQNANAAGVSGSLVDALLERKGSADALISVGWLRVRDGSLEVPNMDRHLSQTAKTRAVTAQRVARHSKKTNANTNDDSVSPPLAREEKSKSKRVLDPKGSNTPPNPQGGNAGVVCLEIDGDIVEFDVDPLRWVAEFIRLWNDLKGAVQHSANALSTADFRRLGDRLAEQDWYWKRAFAQFPLIVPDGVYQITLSKFLEPATVSDILGGKYDAARYERTKPAGLFGGGKSDPSRVRTGKTTHAIGTAWDEALAIGSNGGEVGSGAPGDS